jgi:alpha-aminoadipic semialdehyde synthase
MFTGTDLLYYRARQNGILLLNEIGLDPGLDHCSAISLLKDVKDEGMEPRSFVSFCGGLPAPSSSSNPNPLNYKFSWSPLGVLRAATNGAKYLLNGKVVEMEEGGLLEKSGRWIWDDVGSCVPGWKEFEMRVGGTGMNLVGLPNRDSLPYRDVYGLGDGVRSVVRGTLRCVFQSYYEQSI